MSSSNVDLEILTNFFTMQDNTLLMEVDEVFFEDPRSFKYLKCLIEVLGSNTAYMTDNINMSLDKLKEKNSAVRSLFTQRKFVSEVVEEVVKFQHGALNNSVETMGNVVSEYTRCRSDIGAMRKSIEDIRVVLTAKRSGQVNLKHLWLKKKEQEERIRILDDIERLADAPRRINQLLSKHCYLSAVSSLNSSIANMFSEDLVAVGGLTAAREDLMEQKSRILENIVNQLRDSLLGLQVFETKEDRANSIGDTESVDTRSEQAVSIHSHMRATRPAPLAASASGSYGPSSTEWSMDLSEASEEMEKSLSPDPRTSGTMFIRLLVRAVGCLGVEDDVERMLLDDAPQKLVSTMRALKEKERARIGDYTSLPSDSQQMVFSDYIHKLLDAIYLSLKKLMYGLQLLRLSRSIRQGGSKGQSSANENTKRAMLEISSAVSAVLQKELKVHLVEQEVIAMSDSIQDNTNDVVSSSLFHNGEDEADAEIDAVVDTATVCSPSVRLVAPVYQDIITFSRKIHKFLREECSMTEAEIPPSRIVQTVESISEKELLPIIQSHVSRSMNEIQSDPTFFCPPQRGDSGINNSDAYGASSADVVSSKRLRSGATNSILPRISVAAVKCLSVVKPLLNYWYQLPQHSEAVVTIIDRAIRGFIASARDELENLNWKLQSSHKTALKNVLSGMSVDPFFAEYKRSVYGDNCTSVDELLGLRETSTGGTIATPKQPARKSIRSSVTDRENSGSSMGASIAPAVIAVKGPSDSLSAGNLAGELDSWENLWQLGAPAYGISVDKISSDVFSVSTIAAISLGCDWLVRELCNACMIVVGKARATQKTSSSGVRSSMPQQGSIRMSFSGTLSSSVDDPTAVSTLILTMQSALKGLSLIAEEALGTLRGDVEASCFHFLHHLAHVKFTRSSMVTSVNNNPVPVPSRDKETDNVISSFNKQLIFMQDIFISCSSPEAFAVVVSPSCFLAPRIFMRCVRFLSGPVSPDGFNRLMKAVVACHQSFSMLLESSRLDPSACRRLQDRVTEGFDKVRRYVSFMGGSVKELETYILNSPSDYSYVEYETMWLLLKDSSKPATFEDAWSAVKAGTTLHK